MCFCQLDATATAAMLKTSLETLRAPASEGRVSRGVPMSWNNLIYEKVAVCQRVGLISVCVVLRRRPSSFATQHALWDSLDKHILCNAFWAPATTSLYAA